MVDKYMYVLNLLSSKIQALLLLLLSIHKRLKYLYTAALQKRYIICNQMI